MARTRDPDQIKQSMLTAFDAACLVFCHHDMGVVSTVLGGKVIPLSLSLSSKDRKELGFAAQAFRAVCEGVAPLYIDEVSRRIPFYGQDDDCLVSEGQKERLRQIFEETRGTLDRFLGMDNVWDSSFFDAVLRAERAARALDRSMSSAPPLPNRALSHRQKRPQRPAPLEDGDVGAWWEARRRKDPRLVEKI